MIYLTVLIFQQPKWRTEVFLFFFIIFVFFSSFFYNSNLTSHFVAGVEKENFKTESKRDEYIKKERNREE